MKRSKYKNLKEFDDEKSLECPATIPSTNPSTTTIQTETITTTAITHTTTTTTTTTNLTINSAGPSCDCTVPSTSQLQTTNSEDKPVSQFYQSLLESSYTNDGNNVTEQSVSTVNGFFFNYFILFLPPGQLSEGEMVRAAILVSRAEYIDNQNISISEGQSNNDEDDSL